MVGDSLFIVMKVGGGGGGGGEVWRVWHVVGGLVQVVLMGG